MADIPLNVFGNAAGAQAALVQLEKRLDDMDNRSRQRSRRQQGRLSRWAAGLGQIAAGYIGIHAAVGMVMQANREMLRDIEEAAKAFDESFRKLRIQAGLRGLEGERAQQRVSAIGVQFPISDEPIVAASTVARQMVSSGFAMPEATGGSLREMLRLLGAANQTGADVDFKELTKSTALFMSSQGLELNEANLRTVARGYQSLFRSRNIELPDLTQFAKVGSILATANMTPTEQLGTYGMLAQLFPAEDAKTGLRNFIQNLTSAGGVKPKRDMLEKLGVPLGDVDFVGENIVTVAKRLKAAFDELPEEERLATATKLFDKRGAGVALALLRNIPDLEKAIAEAGDPAAYESDVAEAFAGRVVAGRRQKGLRRYRDMLEDREHDLLLEEADAILRGEGVSAFRRWTARKSAEALIALGASPESAIGTVYSGMTGTGLRFGGDQWHTGRTARERVDDLKEANVDGNELLRDIRDNARPVENRNANGEG